jgi:hypothetical protein
MKRASFTVMELGHILLFLPRFRPFRKYAVTIDGNNSVRETEPHVIRNMNCERQCGDPRQSLPYPPVDGGGIWPTKMCKEGLSSHGWEWPALIQGGAEGASKAPPKHLVGANGRNDQGRRWFSSEGAFAQDARHA